VLFGMSKNILIDVPATKKSIDLFKRLICKDIINYICESKFLISNNDTRKRDIFGFQKLSNIGDHPSVEKISKCTEDFIDYNNELRSLRASDQLNQSIIQLEYQYNPGKALKLVRLY
jgi:hypothetical protein